MDNNIDTTEYGLISGIYFRKLLKTIIDIGEFNQRQLTVLDFGAGKGELKILITKEYATVKVINYDIKKEFTEIEEWNNVNFDIIVCNEVFYTFEEEDLFKLMKDLKKHNQNFKRRHFHIVVTCWAKDIHFTKNILENTGRLGKSDNGMISVCVCFAAINKPWGG